MGTVEEKVAVPEVPVIVGALGVLPEGKKKEWRESYAQAFKEAKNNYPGDESEQRAAATREANRVFRVAEPADYDDAMDLEDWKVMKRVTETVDGVQQLRLVTIDGAKYFFPVPRAAAKAATAGDTEKGKGPGGDGDKK